MNEFLILLETVAGAGWFYLVALVVAAVGMFVFDGRSRRAKAAEQPAKQRMAA